MSLPERRMDPATRWRVVQAIMEEVGCDVVQAVDAVEWFESADSSDGMVLH
jgi:hypothetical protein